MAKEKILRQVDNEGMIDYPLTPDNVILCKDDYTVKYWKEPGFKMWTNGPGTITVDRLIAYNGKNFNFLGFCFNRTASGDTEAGGKTYYCWTAPNEELGESTSIYTDEDYDLGYHDSVAIYMNAGETITQITVIDEINVSKYLHQKESIAHETEEGTMFKLHGIDGFTSEALTEAKLRQGTKAINDRTFYGCNNLSSVTIPDSVTTIGAYAFSGCSSLNGVELPNDLKKIDRGAFKSAGISEIVIPDSVTTIDKYAFDTNSLSAITLPKSLEVIPRHCICSTALSSVTIPQNVKRIESEAFLRCPITSFSVANNKIEYIAPDAIYRYGAEENLAQLSFSGTAAELNQVDWDWTFRSAVTCSDGEFIYIDTDETPQTLEHRDDVTGLRIQSSPSSASLEELYPNTKALYIGSGLTVTTIPYIEEGWDIDSIVVDTNNPSLSSSGNCNIVIQNGPQPVAILGCKNSIIPEGVYGLENFCAYCSGLTSIDFPESLVYISDSFSFTPLNSLHVTRNLTDVDFTTSFQACPLSSITVDSNNSVFDSRDNCNAVIETATNTLVRGCGNSIVPNSVTSIGAQAFINCYELTSFTIPDHIQSIGQSAFFNCSGLTSVAIGSGVTSFGTDAFRNTSISALTLGMPSIPTTFSSNTTLQTLTLLDSVTSIEEWAFRDCTKLTSITIPNSVISIGNVAFDGCHNVSSLTIGSGVTSIGYDAFTNCSGLTSITVEQGNTNYDSRNDCNAVIETSSNTLVYGCKTTVIPDSVVSIGHDAFRGSYGLTSITIPNSLTSIEDWAFWGCSSLTSVIIPNSVTSIGHEAFKACRSFTSITIPNSVNSIADGTFQYCRGLASITIPDSVESIGSYAFDSTAITSITIPSSVTSIANSAFNNCTSLSAATVGMVSIPAIFSGSTSLKSVTFLESAESVEMFAFSGCSSLASVNLGNVRRLQTRAFLDCTSLTSITFPETLVVVSSQAFNGCTSLSSVTLSNTVTNMGSTAFAGCTSLTSIVIPSTLTNIQNSAFVGCTSLQSLIVQPLTINKWGNNLFSGCTSLSIVEYNANAVLSQEFADCTSLTTITLPANLTEIRSKAFKGSGLQTVYFQGTESEWANVSKADDCFPDGVIVICAS